MLSEKQLNSFDEALLKASVLVRRLMFLQRKKPRHLQKKKFKNKLFFSCHEKITAA